MPVLGIHGTGSAIAGKILSSRLQPGRSLANYLGEGVYLYLVHGDGGYRNATDWAKRIARRRYETPVCLIARLQVDNALNLQHPGIRPRYAKFRRIFDRRLKRLRLHVDPNDNASYFRPISYLAIEAFRRCIEAISHHPIDVLSATFTLRDRDLDITPPYEICVKRASAILSVERCGPIAETVSASSDPASWPCPSSVVEAAEHASLIIDAMDDRDFLDLIQSIYQGSGCWDGPKSRFAGPGPILLLYDSRHQGRPAEIAELVAGCQPAAGRAVECRDLAEIAWAKTPEARVGLAALLGRVSGIVALITSAAADAVSILVSAADRRPDLPILAMLGSDDASAGSIETPIFMRSRHNMCCVTMPGPKAAAELVKGFLHDRWTDSLAMLDIEGRMAARHGTRDVRHRDARKIVEAIHARKHNLL